MRGSVRTTLRSSRSRSDAVCGAPRSVVLTGSNRRTDPPRRSRRVGVRLGWAALAVLLTASPRPGPVRADAAADARFFDEQGRKAFAAGRYEEALRAFLQSVAASRNVNQLFNVAFCAERAGEPALAVSYYRRFLAAADDDASRREVAQRNLEALTARLAMLEVTSDPPGASVYLDREELGSYGRTPLAVPAAPGVREVILRLEHHAPVALRVTAAPRRAVPVHGELAPHQGRLVAAGQPEGGRFTVFRDGEPVLEAGGSLDHALPVGRYEVRYTLDGWVPERRTVRVRRDAVQRVVVSLAREAGPRGRLLVTAGGQRATVRLDGATVGETPLVLPDVPAGAHVVEVVHADGRVQRREVDVEADRGALVRVPGDGG